jgi:hypothetical protein
MHFETNLDCHIWELQKVLRIKHRLSLDQISVRVDQKHREPLWDARVELMIVQLSVMKSSMIIDLLREHSQLLDEVNLLKFYLRNLTLGELRIGRV